MDFLTVMLVIRLLVLSPALFLSSFCRGSRLAGCNTMSNYQNQIPNLPGMKVCDIRTKTLTGARYISRLFCSVHTIVSSYVCIFSYVTLHSFSKTNKPLSDRGKDHPNQNVKDVFHVGPAPDDAKSKASNGTTSLPTFSPLSSSLSSSFLYFFPNY